MKRTAFYLMFLISICSLTSCATLVRHSDPFYNFNDSDFPRDYLPLINPIKATREQASSPWVIELANYLWVNLPNSQTTYPYSYVEELERIAVKNEVIMAYSSYVDKQANAYIQDRYYHWFVMVPSKNVTVGFHTEDEFNQYVQTLGIQEPNWQTPDEAFKKFTETGCLEWIPDCK